MWAKRAILAVVLGSAAAASGCCECCKWCTWDRAPAKYPQTEGPTTTPSYAAPPSGAAASTAQPTGAYGGTGN